MRGRGPSQERTVQDRAISKRSSVCQPLPRQWPKAQVGRQPHYDDRAATPTHLLFIKPQTKAFLSIESADELAALSL